LSINKNTSGNPFPEASLQIALDQYYTTEISPRQIKKPPGPQKITGFFMFRTAAWP